MGAVSACLFDMDGLLLDTEVLYTRVQQDIASRWDKTFTMEIKSRMMGKKALAAASVFVEALDLQDVITPEAFVAEREALLDEMFKHETELMPGAEELLQTLKRAGVPMALATSSHRRHFELKTTRHRALFDAVFGDNVITGDQVARGKPAPDIFLTAAALLGVPPERCVVFEDAPAGVEAANRAGMKSVMVPDAALDHVEGYTRGADVVCGSLREVDLAALGLLG
jgi:HAD superfamily hydrolase (TIGR01509 family)